MKDWAEVIAFTTTLHGVETGTSYGKPAVKLNGRMLAATTAPDPASFVVHTALDDKEVLLDTDPTTFWETDHYRGWPAVLVRSGSADPARVELVLVRAWWDRAKMAQRRAFGTRP